MIPAVMCSRIHLYAVDSQYLKDMHNISDCDLLQDDLGSLSNWSLTWHMDLNSSKYDFIKFSNRVMDSSYTLNSKNIRSITEHNYVGVLLMFKLSFSEHLKIILAKAHHSWAC